MSYTFLKSDFTAAAVALSLAASGLASAEASSQSSVASGVARAEATVDPVIHMERGAALSEAGRFDEAIGEYALAAEAMRAAGELPTAALWRTAELYQARGNERQAARTLSALATEAREKGDAVVEASALLEATVLYSDAGMSGQARQATRRLEQLRALTSTPAESSAS